MVLADLGKRITGAVSGLVRSDVVDDKVRANTYGNWPQQERENRRSKVQHELALTIFMPSLGPRQHVERNLCCLARSRCTPPIFFSPPPTPHPANPLPPRSTLNSCNPSANPSNTPSQPLPPVRSARGSSNPPSSTNSSPSSTHKPTMPSNPKKGVPTL